MELFDHMVGAGEQGGRQIELDHPCGAKIDYQLELGGLLDRYVNRLGSTQQFDELPTNYFAVELDNARPVPDQPALIRDLRPLIHRWQPQRGHSIKDNRAIVKKERRCEDIKRVCLG